MKKIKMWMMALAAIVLTAGMTACSSNDDGDTGSNYDRYQKEVNNTVNTQKKHNKVILLVAFGST